MDFGCVPRDLRQQASFGATHDLVDLGFGGFRSASSGSADRFRYSGERTTSMTSITNPFFDHQRNLVKLNTKATSMVGLCQNLSKVSISDDANSLFTGSHPFLVDSGFSGSRNLGGCSRFDQNLSLYDVSSRGGVSMDDGDCHKFGLLGFQDFANPKLRGFTKIMSRPDISLIPQKSGLDIHQELMYSGNRVFCSSLSAIGGGSQKLGVSTKSMKKSSFKEDCNGNHEEDFPLSLASMVGIYGSVYLMAKDQIGCRFLQKLVEGANFHDAAFIFREVINHIIELGIDPFGNYLVQKLLQVCSEQQRTQIIIMFTSKPGLLVQISLNTYGTRIVQKLIETVTTKEQISLVKSALKPGFLSLVIDLHGNRVILSCLQSLGPNDNQFIFEAATNFCGEIATHRHGCCVLQRCVLYSDRAQREKLVAEISRNSLLLAQDPYGNYVVQYIIEQKIGLINLMFELRGNYVALATQKFGSHVVEKCLRHYRKSRSQIVQELVSVPNFESLLQDPFANYVIQSALSVTKGFLRERLVEKVRRYGNLKTSPYCKKIFSRSFFKKM